MSSPLLAEGFDFLLNEWIELLEPREDLLRGLGEVLQPRRRVGLRDREVIRRRFREWAALFLRCLLRQPIPDNECRGTHQELGLRIRHEAVGVREELDPDVERVLVLGRVPLAIEIVALTERDGGDLRWRNTGGDRLVERPQGAVGVPRLRVYRQEHL